MDAALEQMLYVGVSVEVQFSEPRPLFGDLYLICGERHPRFAPSGAVGFEDLADLQFDQCDDYFGVPSLSNDGDDVAIWLYPVVGGHPVEHHPGPFDALRLEFNVLRNPVRHGEHFLRCVERFGVLGRSITYRGQDIAVSDPVDLRVIREDMDAIVEHWRRQGIIVGSPDALEVDF